MERFKGRDYWKEIGLVLLGGLLTGLPILISSYINLKGESYRLLLDRRLIVIKDLATCSEQYRTKLIPMLDDCIDQYGRVISDFKQHRHSIAEVDKLNTMIRNHNKELCKFAAEYDPVILSASILYHIEVPLIPAQFKSYSSLDKVTTYKLESDAIKQLEIWRSESIQNRKTLTNNFNCLQDTLKKLARMTASDL